MTIKYRYIGIFTYDNQPDNPSGLIRSWTDADGLARAEVFTRALVWKETSILTRPYDDDLIEIDESVAASVVEIATERYGGRS
jgi:hypothetical protein